MGEIFISPSVAQRIVEVGTNKRLVSKQTIRKPEQNQPRRSTGIFFAKTTSAWTQNSTRNAVLSAELNEGNGKNIFVQSPLSRSGDQIAANTRIVVAVISGMYYLIQAECE